MTLVNSLPEEPKTWRDLHAYSILYSNARLLQLAFGELCKACSLYHPSFVSSTETHLFGDPVDSIWPSGYAKAARRK